MRIERGRLRCAVLDGGLRCIAARERIASGGRRLDLAALYTPHGRYDYRGGLNVRAVVAVAIGWAVALIGLAVPALRVLWTGGWLFGLAGGFIAYALLMRGEPSVIDAPEYVAITAGADAAAPAPLATEAAIS